MVRGPDRGFGRSRILPVRHVMMQWQVSANTSETVGTNLAAGTYRLRSPQMNETQELRLVQNAPIVLVNTAAYSVLFRLESLGWRSLAIWECQMRDEAFLQNEIRTFLDA